MTVNQNLEIGSKVKVVPVAGSFLLRTTWFPKDREVFATVRKVFANGKVKIDFDFSNSSAKGRGGYHIEPAEATLVPV